jgi:orotate phosphoribosyltransferase
MNTYLPEECPLCKKGVPVVKPGSREVWKGYWFKEIWI